MQTPTRDEVIRLITGMSARLERIEAMLTASPALPAAKPTKSKPATEQEVVAYCASLGLPNSDGRAVWSKWLGNGFCNNHKPMRDWQAVIRSWKAYGYLPSQKQAQVGRQPQRGATVTPSNKGISNYRVKELDNLINAATSEIEALGDDPVHADVVSRTRAQVKEWQREREGLIA